MGDPSGVRVRGPLEPFARGFADRLASEGYTANSAALQLGVMAHASRCLAAGGWGVEDLTVARVEEFLSARRAAGYRQYLSAKAMAPLMGYPRGLGVAPALVRGPMTPADALLGRYREWLIGERSVAAGTARGYADAVRPFVTSQAGPDGAPRMRGVEPADITGFVVAVCPGMPTGTAKLTVTALRSLLRWMCLQGWVDATVASAVPSVAGWRLSGLPRALPPDQLRLMLAACDPSTVAGRRALAVVTLLSRLGLRAGEVAGLLLDDIDWRAGELVVRGKGDRHERMPLPVDVGEAIVAWLRDGRRAIDGCRNVFVRLRAPRRALTSGGVSQVVAAAAARAGLAPVTAHRLRHSAATELLRAGASLGQVGQVLRHRSPLTTAMYAKVHDDALRLLARPWPGVAL